MVKSLFVPALGGLFVLIVSAVILVILGLVFFAVNLWIINAAMGLMDITAAGEYVVLSAAILSAASMLGSRRL